MTKEHFKAQLIRLKIAYPYWQVELNDVDFLKEWWKAFKEMPEEKFTSLVESYIQNQKASPTIAGLLNPGKGKKTEFHLDESRFKNYTPAELEKVLQDARQATYENIKQSMEDHPAEWQALRLKLYGGPRPDLHDV